MKTWLKHLFALALLAAVIPLDAGVIVKDLHPGKTPDTKNIRFTKSSDLCTMEFGSGNGPKARAWMRQYHPMLNIGERLKISLQVRSSNVSGANSRVFINVLTLDGKRKNLNSKSFDKMFPLTGTNGKWQKIETVFTMPDPAVTRNWQNGKILLIAFGAAAQTGLFEFKDFTVEKLQPLALTQQTSRKLYQSSLNNPDFVYNVKTSAQTPAQSFDILLPAVADMNGYQPILSFDFALEKDSPQVMPVLEVDGKVMPEHDHRHLPRLLNAKNPSDGGSKRYMYNLKKILSTSNILSVRISAGDKSRFTVKNIKLSYKAETWPLYPDAPKPQKNALTILPGKSLRVNLNGKPLIVGENVTGAADLEKLDDKALHITRKDGRIVTHNLVQLNDPTVDFRREARILPNGELEIFMRNYYKKRSPESIGYRFMMPADFLRGAKFELLCGRGSKNTTVKGKLEFGNERFIRNIFPNEKTGIPVTHIQYLCLEKDGVKLIMDFAPLTVTGQCTPYCMEPQRVVNYVYKKGDMIYFDLNRRPNPELHSYFVRIYVSEYDHFFRHGLTTTTYTTGPFFENLGYNISFADEKGTAKVNTALFPFPSWQRIYQMPFQSAKDLVKGTELILPGYLKRPAGSKTYTTEGLLPGSAGFFAPSGKAVYQVPVEPGIYMCSVVAGHSDRAVESLSVKCNGEVVAENVSVLPNNFRTIFFSVYVKSPDKHIKLEFDGKNYAVNRLFVSNVQNESEDYVWKNDFWQVKGLPGFPLGADHTKPATANTMPRPPEVLGRRVSENVPQDGKYPDAGKAVYPEPGMEALPKTKDLDWAWNLRITDISSGNSESGFSYRPNEEFRQYCRTIKANGYNAVIEQGLFWYCTYDDATRAEHMKNQKGLIKILHEEGLKAIRHADGPSFNAIYQGAFNTARAAGWFPVDMGTLRSFQGGGCISNPFLREHVMEHLVKYVKETDCDMLMIDELSIFRMGANCACEFCRKKFAEDTGYSLPMPDNQTPLFEKPGNHLNAVWMDWKLRQDGNFFNELKRRLAKIKKEVLITSYGVDFQHPIGRFQKLAPYLNVVGIEGTNHYLLANYRHLLVCRKMQAASADEYGHSQWHLHYDDWGISQAEHGTIRYLYRAFNSLNRAGILSRIGTPPLKNAHVNWPYWPNYRTLKPIADVGVYHHYDPYYRTDTPYLASEQFGISQLLSDKHVPHEFIIKITPERLKKFKLVILGNVTILDDDEINILKDYVKNGGKLLICGTFGAFDQKFVAQNSKRYTDLTGVEFANELLPRKAVHDYQTGRINTHLAKVRNISGKVLLTLADGTPAVISKNYGKGMVITTPLTPGMAAFENIIIRGRKFVEVKTAEGAALLDKLLAYTNHTQYPVMISADSKILAESSIDSKNNVVNIQLMNFNLNTRFIPGKVPVRLNNVVGLFMEPLKPVTITLPGKAVAASAVSPDYPGEHALKVKHLANGSSEITLDGKLLKIYTLIKIRF